MRCLTTLLLALACTVAAASGAAAQGGVPAPAPGTPGTGSCPSSYPGDDAAKGRIARWMGAGASARGLPPELPVMAGLAESGLSNLRGASYSGFFGMHRTLNEGRYRGFARRPARQLVWFLDTAALVRQRRVAEALPDPAADPSAFGLWVADVERPAPENRSGYQKYLADAAAVAPDGCPGPAEPDTTPPALRARVAKRQRPLRSGGVVASVRCVDDGCLVGAGAGVTYRSRAYELSADALEPGDGAATVTLALPKRLRRALARGRSLRAAVTVSAADPAANPARLERSVTLLGG